MGEVEPVVDCQCNIVGDQGEKIDFLFQEAVLALSCEAEGAQAAQWSIQRKHTKGAVALLQEEPNDARQPDFPAGHLGVER